MSSTLRDQQCLDCLDMVVQESRLSNPCLTWRSNDHRAVAFTWLAPPSRQLRWGEERLPLNLFGSPISIRISKIQRLTASSSPLRRRVRQSRHREKRRLLCYE